MQVEHNPKIKIHTQKWRSGSNLFIRRERKVCSPNWATHLGSHVCRT